MTRGFDVIHACNPPEMLFLLGALYKLLGKKFVFDHHDLSPELYESKFGRRGLIWRLQLLLERLTFWTADLSIATNNSIRSVALERGKMNPGDVVTVRTGPDLKRIRSLPPDEKWKAGRRFMVAYVGIIGNQDGLDLLIEAIGHIRYNRDRDDIQYVIIGDGAGLPNIKRLSRDAGLDDVITFVGRVDDDQKLCTILSTADVCVNPDRPNGLNDKSTTIKTMEYMAIGKPIVQFDLTEGRRSAEGASLYAQGADTKDFGDKILELLDDPKRAKELGETGQRRVRDELSWGHEEKKFLALYERVLPDRNRGRGQLRVCMLGYAFYETDNRIRRYAEALVKRGDQVDAIVLARDGQPPFGIVYGVNVFRIQKRVINEKGQLSYLIRVMMFLALSTWSLTARHLRKPYDVIHVHSVPDFEVLATVIPRLMGARVILDIHDLVPELYVSKFKGEDRSIAHKILLALEGLSCAYSNHVIISNDLWYEKIIQRSVRAEKCTSIINYPDLSIFWPRPRVPAANGDFVMCYPGTLNSHQGVDLAIEAVFLLRNRAPNLKLMIVGDGQDRKKLEGLVRKLGVEDRVSLTSFVPLEQIAELMSTIDLGVVPKRKNSFGNEAFSTKIMEFLAMNVPVVASRTRIDEYYFTDQVVQFFESGNAADLANKICELMEKPERRAELRRNGSEFIAHNNWGIKGPEYLRLVDRLST